MMGFNCVWKWSRWGSYKIMLSLRRGVSTWVRCVVKQRVILQIYLLFVQTKISAKGGLYFKAKFDLKAQI